MRESFLVVLAMLTGVGLAMSMAWVEHRSPMPVWVFMVLFVVGWLVMAWRITVRMDAEEAADAEEGSHADHD